MEQLRFQRNAPFTITPLKDLWTVPEEVNLIRPGASFPIKDEEWVSYFADKDRYSILVYEKRNLIGHFGLVKEIESRFRIVFVFLIPSLRGGEMAQLMMQAVETFAQEEFSAEQLSLNVQDFNPRALALYKKCGFKEFCRNGATIRMEKILGLKDKAMAR